MKRIVIITLIMLSAIIASDCAPEQPHPVDCYEVNLIIDSASGDIIKNTARHIFVYEANEITHWEGMSSTVTRDSVNNTITIKMVKCISIDSKKEYSYI